MLKDFCSDNELIDRILKLDGAPVNNYRFLLNKYEPVVERIQRKITHHSLKRWHKSFYPKLRKNYCL